MVLFGRIFPDFVGPWESVYVAACRSPAKVYLTQIVLGIFHFPPEEFTMPQANTASSTSARKFEYYQCPHEGCTNTNVHSGDLTCHVCNGIIWWLYTDGVKNVPVVAVGKPNFPWYALVIFGREKTKTVFSAPNPEAATGRTLEKPEGRSLSVDIIAEHGDFYLIGIAADGTPEWLPKKALAPKRRSNNDHFEANNNRKHQAPADATPLPVTVAADTPNIASATANTDGKKNRHQSR